MNLIREQIIQICKDIFDSQVASIRRYDDSLKKIMPSSVPKAMIIAEFDPCTRSLNKIKEGYNSSEIISAWKYSEGVLEPIELTKEPDMMGPKGVYYKETYARFAFSEEKKVLYLNIFFAPLSARGWRYSIVETDRGLALGNRVEEWVS